MNKLACIALLAFTCQVVLGFGSDFDDWSQPLEIDEEQHFDPQIGLVPSDEEEVRDLQPNKAAFKGFCLATRDYVIGDIRHSTNTLAASVFNLIFKAADEIVVDAKQTNQRAVDLLGKQIENPNSPISEDSSTEADRIIVEGQKNLAKQTNILNAVSTALRATKATIVKSALEKFNTLKEAYGVFSTADAFTEGCAQIARYEEEINRRFEEAKAQAATSDPSLANVQLNDVFCITSKRVGRFDGLCKFARVARGPLMSILTYAQ